MKNIDTTTFTAAERAYCSSPDACLRPTILIVGSGIGLEFSRYLACKTAGIACIKCQIVVIDAGPLDLMTHVAHMRGYKRLLFLRDNLERIGGRLSLWGMSTPRPTLTSLQSWPYDPANLEGRFKAVERELGVDEPIPLSGGLLERMTLRRLADSFPDAIVRPAPLAIDHRGERWSPLRHVPILVEKLNVRLVSHFRCTELAFDQGRVSALTGTWLDGQNYTFEPQFVVLATGMDAILPLSEKFPGTPRPMEASDHIRIDLHGQMPTNVISDILSSDPTSDQIGVAVVLVETTCRQSGVPYHLEVKIAAASLWAKGYLPSSDNLCGDTNDSSLLVQIQCVAAMHDRFPHGDLLNIHGRIHPVMSTNDALFHGELVAKMADVAKSLGLTNMTWCPRPLLENHHHYGAFRVGGAVTKEFRWTACENLYVLPPTAYVDADDDANPTLKSLVLSQYAADDILNRMVRNCDEK